MKECDADKDIEIDSFAQITLPKIQMPLFQRALRGYVKSIDGKAYYRVELALSPHQPIEMALDRIRKKVIIEVGLHYKMK